MLENYEIVELIAIVQRLIDKFTIVFKKHFCTDAFSKQRNLKENLGYNFVSYF